MRLFVVLNVIDELKAFHYLGAAGNRISQLSALHSNALNNMMLVFNREGLAKLTS